MYEEDPSKCGRVLFGDMSNSQQVMMMVTLLSRMMVVTISIIEDHFAGETQASFHMGRQPGCYEIPIQKELVLSSAIPLIAKR